ncbi:MAG: glycosyltransferase family protein [Alphaproteobacteria bacterium]|nr:glycosyltransferase family protein [Alphaproteobacteria bacterium]
MSAPETPVEKNAALPEDVRRALMEKFDAAAAHQQDGRLAEAITLYQQVLLRAPGHAPSWINMGVALRGVGHIDAGVASLFRGVAIKPNDAGALSNLGNALRAAGRLTEAQDHHRQAVELAPEDGSFYYNLALALRDSGDLSAAMSCFKDAEVKGYDKAELHWDRALTRLLDGDMRRGFADYEWRWKIADAKTRDFTQPVWTGETLKAGASGKSGTLLVYAEQGFGDAIQFFRYLPLLKEKAARIIFECQAPLARLFKGSAIGRDVDIIPREDSDDAKILMPAFDAQVALLSAPHFLGESENLVPGAMPYLTPPPGAHSITAPKGHLKVGLTWAGKPTHRNDRNRSTPLKTFMPLIDMPGITFFSLQLGPPADEIAQSGAGALVHDLQPYLRDFTDTAAVLSEMDLVICVDTSLAHLAGAMARPVWTLLPYAPDWRWLLNRSDTPWYPSMRLFRPDAPLDWSGVIAQVKAALVDFKASFDAASSGD